MLEKTSNDLYSTLHDEINKIIAEESDQFKALSNILKCVRTALEKLRGYILDHPFKSDAEQIWFFKYVKPKFYSLKLFYLERYGIQTSLPSGDPENTKKFYLDELTTITKFFQRVAFHYQYYRTGAEDLDSQYFLRGIEINSPLVPDTPEIDPEFSTGQDYLFSKFKAYEMLQAYILKQLRTIDPQSYPAPPVSEEKVSSKLAWTGDKTNLVEVIYGLFYTGQLNSGNATVADIIKWMEHNLQIDLSRSYRNFIDIRNRKRDSPTKFLDKMREFILQRIDEDNTFKPNRGIKLQGERQ